ncbi:MAG: sugar ABC transporter permease [Candidatus Hydrogenedentota bacterium]
MSLFRRTSDVNRSNILAYALIAPALAVLLPFAISPFFYAIYLSLFEFEANTSEYIGGVHYVAAIQSEGFWNSVRVTIYFAVGTVIPTLLISTILALVLSHITRLQSFLRIVYFLPFITSVVAAAMIWRAMFEPINGPITQLFMQLGLERQDWLLEPRGVLHILTGGAIDPTFGPSLALCCVMVFEIWRSIGFMVVILLAALTQRSKGLEEAATLEGANRTQLAWHVILPGISPTLMFLTVVATIQSFQAFNGFFALTGDGRGPLDTTQNMTVYIYTQFYEYGHIGYGSANAVLLSLAIMAFTVVQLRLTGQRMQSR